MSKRYQDLTGQRFGQLIAEKFVETGPSRNAVWLCQCDCGKKKNVQACFLKRGYTKSCGCLYSTSKEGRIDLAGQRFGSLVALSPSADYKWLCQCDCGQKKEIYAGSLRSGDTKSCGCRNLPRLDREILLNEYNSGTSVTNLAQQYGCSKARIYRAVRQQKKASS